MKHVRARTAGKIFGAWRFFAQALRVRRLSEAGSQETQKQTG
jgi:hypothetical protein